MIGHPRKKCQDWFDENNQKILGLLAEKKAAHAALLSDKDCTAKRDRFKKLMSEAQSKTREMKDGGRLKQNSRNTLTNTSLGCSYRASEPSTDHPPAP